MTTEYTKHFYGDDWTGDAGAYRLAERIHQYWLKRGYDVHVEALRLPYAVSARMAPLTLTSDMINGLPRQAAKQQGRAV